MAFTSDKGLLIPSLTSDQMREVDRVAVEDFGLGILQMMENAGRNLAQLAFEYLANGSGQVGVLAGPGGNGGGGLCCARHLHNHGIKVSLLLSKPSERLGDAAGNQLRILESAGVIPLDKAQFKDAINRADLIIDALIGYSLRGAPHGTVRDMIELCNKSKKVVISLDIPSGVDSTSGERPGASIKADATLTLALPKLGLNSSKGKLFLADIGIPPEVYRRLGIEVDTIFKGKYIVPLHRQDL